MAVIINSKTSGCAELFAQDLKDFREYDVTLIGDKSAGIWTKQELFRLKDGNAVMMTVAKIMPYISDPFRNNKNGEGITPDIAVSLTPEQEKNLDQLDMADDIQIQTAFNTLREAQG